MQANNNIGKAPKTLTYLTNNALRIQKGKIKRRKNCKNRKKEKKKKQNKQKKKKYIKKLNKQKK